MDNIFLFLPFLFHLDSVGYLKLFYSSGFHYLLCLTDKCKGFWDYGSQFLDCDIVNFIKHCQLKNICLMHFLIHSIPTERKILVFVTTILFKYLIIMNPEEKNDFFLQKYVVFLLEVLFLRHCQLALINSGLKTSFVRFGYSLLLIQIEGFICALFSLSGAP